MFFRKDLNELEEIFGVRCIETRGNRTGKIFKFRDYYLKLYDDPKQESTYIIEGYVYGEDVPFSVDHVKYRDICKYAECIKKR